MRDYYQMSAEDVRQEINGTQEPLTMDQIREHQEKYGPNELVEGKKKTTLQIFLEQYKDFLVIIINNCWDRFRFSRRHGEYPCYFDRYHNECDPWDRTDRKGRTVS